MYHHDKSTVLRRHCRRRRSNYRRYSNDGCCYLMCHCWLVVVAIATTVFAVMYKKSLKLINNAHKKYIITYSHDCELSL